MGLIMILSEITVLLVVFMLSAVSCFEIQRVTYGYEIDSFRGNIYNSEDSFTNQQRYDEDCTKRNSSCLTINCKNGACCRCKCNEGLTFLSYHHGCLGPDDIRRNSDQKCSYIFYYQTEPVVPAFKDRHNDLLNAAAVRIGVRHNTLQQIIEIEDKYITCVAGSVNEIHPRGITTLLDPNHNSSFFEIQQVYHPRSNYKGLILTDRAYAAWKKLEGRLISLKISCFNHSRKFELSSCLMFKVNGTLKSDKTPTKVTSTHSTIGVTKVSTKDIRKTSGHETTTLARNNGTVLPVVTQEGSGSVGLIVGTVLGILFLIVAIVLVWFYCKRRKQRSAMENKADSNKAENGNSIAAKPFDGVTEGPHTQASENPYYRGANGDTLVNHYLDPSVIIKDSSTTHGGNEVYYSTADALKNQKEQKPLFEYSYARGTTKDPENPDQEQYQTLGKSKYEPETYQALDTGIETEPVKKTLEQDNPYYTPSTASDSLLEVNNSDVNKGLSLKNNAGSREDVSVLYETVYPDDDTKQYQGLTIPSKKNDYEPLRQDEYQDMSYGEKSDGEYMYATN